MSSISFCCLTRNTKLLLALCNCFSKHAKALRPVFVSGHSFKVVGNGLTDIVYVNEVTQEPFATMEEVQRSVRFEIAPSEEKGVVWPGPKFEVCVVQKRLGLARGRRHSSLSGKGNQMSDFRGVVIRDQ